MKTLRDVWSDIWKFESLSKQRQDEIVDIIKADGGKDSYYFGYAIEYALPHVDKATAMELFKKYISTGSRRYRIEDVIMVVKRHDAATTKDILSSAQDDYCKYLLCFDGISLDEEERGLRSIAKSTRPPNCIFSSEYKPTLDGLRRLPSIMRLKCLQSLTNIGLASYNIFGNIKDAEEFKSLMFSSSLKHQKLAETIWKRYQDISGVGIPSSIKIVGRCDKCGDFEFVINNKVVRTSEGLKKTRAQALLYQNCFACSTALSSPPIITEGDWIQ